MNQSDDITVLAFGASSLKQILHDHGDEDVTILVPVVNGQPILGNNDVNQQVCANIEKMSIEEAMQELPLAKVSTIVAKHGTWGNDVVILNVTP